MIWRIWLIFGQIPQSWLSTAANNDSILQWTFPLLIPSLRIFSCWIAQKISKIFPETDNEDVDFLVTSTLTLEYTNFVATRMWKLQQITVYGILIIEILLHIKACYDIFKLNKKIELDPHSAFAMAYYGPNATLMKEIKNNYFGEQEIEDLQYFYFILILMFLFDLLAMVTSGFFLKHFCKIDLFQGFCNMMDRYWIIFLIKVPFLMDYFGMKDINYGIDHSEYNSNLDNKMKKGFV